MKKFNSMQMKIKFGQNIHLSNAFLRMKVRSFQTFLNNHILKMTIVKKESLTVLNSGPQKASKMPTKLNAERLYCQFHKLTRWSSKKNSYLSLEKTWFSRGRSNEHIDILEICQKRRQISSYMATMLCLQEYYTLSKRTD